MNSREKRIVIGLLVALGLVSTLHWGAAVAQEEGTPEPAAAPGDTAQAPERPQTTRRLPDQISIFGGEIRIPADTEVRGDVISIGAEVWTNSPLGDRSRV